MNRALGIPSIGLTSIFRSAIELLIHRELFGTTCGLLITGEYADMIARHIAGKFGLLTACADESEVEAIIRYPENLDIPCNEHIQVKLGASRATIYRLVKTGSLTLAKISDRTSSITEESLNRYIANIKMHHNAPKKLGSQIGSQKLKQIKQPL